MSFKQIIVRKISLIILFFTLTFSVKAQIYKEKYIKDATMVANNWLNNVVTKNYGIAYFDYSQQVKENSDSTYWIQAVDQLMKEFGTFKKREIIKSEFKNNLENLGDGFYVFIEYKSNYKNVEVCNEYMLLGQNDKLQWKILRYDFSYESNELDNPNEKSSN